MRDHLVCKRLPHSHLLACSLSEFWQADSVCVCVCEREASSDGEEEEEKEEEEAYFITITIAFLAGCAVCLLCLLQQSSSQTHVLLGRT